MAWPLSILSTLIVLSSVYSKQPIFGLTQEWFRELYCGVHDKLHISSADWWDILLIVSHPKDTEIHNL